MSAIQHMPGRLRLKFPQLKNRPDLADAAIKAIRRLQGIRLVQANVFTGSLLIHYDVRGGKQGLLAAIDEINRGLGLESSPAVRPVRASPSLGDQVIDRLIRIAIGKALQGSRLAFLSVLL